MDSKPTADHSSPFDDGDLYDLMMEGLTYGIDFYVGLAKTAKGPILDIACGTGRVLLPCLQAGAKGDGLDLSEAMLRTLKTKADARGLSPAVYASDMSNFDLPSRYALIMITFNAFIHNMTQDAQIRCLECCRRHLMPRGLLAFDTFFPSLEIIGAPPGTRVLESEKTEAATGRTLRMYDTRTFDRVAQTQHSINDLEWLDAEGKIESVRRFEFTTRYLYKQEMTLLLRLAGFARWEILGDFGGRPLERETDAMIVKAWNDGEGDGRSA
jgi:SAM-dependent methyltransferase